MTRPHTPAKGHLRKMRVGPAERVIESNLRTRRPSDAVNVLGPDDWIGVAMSERTCSVNGCERDYHCKGWCQRHYERWRRTGSPDFPPPLTAEDRFFARVDVWPGICWEWMGWRTHLGYGGFSVMKKHIPAHRWSYEYMIGPIPDGLELDHLCRNPPCVNPDHLEPVTHQENARRGLAGHQMAKRTKCPSGHPYSGTNLFITNRGNRVCLTCRRQSARDYKARLKARK